MISWWAPPALRRSREVRTPAHLSNKNDPKIWLIVGAAIAVAVVVVLLPLYAGGSETGGIGGTSRY